MSQSVSLFSPSAPSHSCILLAASGCSAPLRVHSRKNCWQVAAGKLEEVVVGIAQFRLGAGHRGIGLDEVSGRIRRAAHFAVVAVLVLGVALGAFALDEAIRQEHVLDRVEILLDGADFDQAVLFQGAVDALGRFLGLVRVGGAVVVEMPHGKRQNRRNVPATRGRSVVPA